MDGDGVQILFENSDWTFSEDIHATRQDIPALLAHIKAQDEQINKKQKTINHLHQIFKNTKRAEMMVELHLAEIERDAHKARAEALERAISHDCKLCKHYSDSVAVSESCAACVMTRDLGRSNWEFDIERLEGGANDE